MDFSDKEHSVAELVFQGAPMHPIEKYCGERILEALESWQTRQNNIEPEPSLLRLENTRSFVISYEGKTREYWPDEPSNFVGETLVREFLFQDGICKLDSLEPRFYTVHYKLIAFQETEFLLVLPFPTSTGNISGVLVVCVNQHLKPDAPKS